MIIQAPQGIVLRTFMPYAHKLLILDVHHGKIQVVPQVSQGKKKAGYIPHGALLHYEYTQRVPLAFLSDIELLQVPEGIFIQDFYFLHHVLELCDYFLPFEQQVPEIFNLILALYTCATPLSAKEQRLFLYHFFISIGILPAHSTSLIFKQNESNVDTKDAQATQELYNFLLGCLYMHPYAHLLKTLPVIKKLTTH